MNLLNQLAAFLDSDEGSDQPAKVSLQRQFVIDPVTSRPRILVRRDTSPLWRQRGWQQQDSDFAGYYKTSYGSWPGYITVSPSGRIDVFVENPPRELERHPHWQCFRPREGGWFFIHATKPVPDVSAAILSTEKTLTEAFEL